MSGDGSEEFRRRWMFMMRCRVCDSTFEELQPNVGVEVLPGFSRLVLLRVPEVCSECKSLQVVGAQPPASSSPEGPASA